MLSRVAAFSSRFLKRGRTFSSAPAAPLVELREYDLCPQYVSGYLKATAASAETRMAMSPLRLFSLPETGGGPLHVATHAYYYEGGHAERDAARSSMAKSEEWGRYVEGIRAQVREQRSCIFAEAPLVREMDQVPGLAGPFPGCGDSPILEFRRYRLILGYDTVPHFYKLYQSGLSSKLATCDPTTSLITLMHTEVGRLNEVIEIWRHGNGSRAMEQSRHNARQATEWKDAISSIAPLAVEFTSTIHKPTSFSPLQ